MSDYVSTKIAHQLRQQLHDEKNVRGKEQISIRLLFRFSFTIFPDASCSLPCEALYYYATVASAVEQF